MIHRILVDSDVILDVFIDREPHHSVALRFFSYLDLNRSTVIGHVSPLAIANVAYILTKSQSQSYAIKKLRVLRQILQVVSLEISAIDAAIAEPGKDFEDTLQYQCAVANNLSTILTRNVTDFPRDAITIVTPREFLAMDFVDKST